MDTLQIDQCEICIAGAGIAGLNALFAASQYLGRNDRVVLVDRRTRVGGMWTDTYDYVRLHQPYQLFTAGNIKCTLGKERSYLATKPEFLDHLRHCLDVISRRVDVDERFGWDVPIDTKEVRQPGPGDVAGSRWADPGGYRQAADQALRISG